MYFHVEDPDAGSVINDTVSSESPAHVLVEKAYIPREELMYVLKFQKKRARGMLSQVRVKEIVRYGGSNRWNHRWPRS